MKKVDILPLVCFGCGHNARTLIDYMDVYGLNEFFYIEYFLDNKVVGNYQSWECFKPQPELVEGKTVLITSTRYENEISSQLELWGLRKGINFFFYSDLASLLHYRQEAIDIGLPTLKVSFRCFADIPRIIFIHALMKNFKVQIVENNADIVLTSVFGNSEIGDKDAIKILYTGENTRADFEHYDYNIGFDYNEDTRYLRFPLYFLYIDSYLGTAFCHKRINIDEFMSRSFACRVVSKQKSEFREKFFEAIDAHHYVASGGKLKNNLPEKSAVKDKIAFIQKYKFNLAFENAKHMGYVTEKIVDAFSAGCIPIYWGDSTIDKQFNINSFIQISDQENIEHAIEYILNVSDDKDFLEKMLITPKLVEVINPVNVLSKYLADIVNTI